MKIEFRKIPLTDSEISLNSDSVEFSGIFSKISSRLAKVDAKFSGNCDVECCKCGKSFNIELDEKLNLLLSDGIYESNNDEDDEKIIIEVEDHIVDFEEILQSEIESLRSEYYICDDCTDREFVEVEY